MNIGPMDRRIQLLEEDMHPDDRGHPVPTLMLIAEVWAQAIPIRGQERFSADQMVAKADVRFRIRYRGDVRPTQQLRFDGRLYDVQEVAELGRREGLEVLAQARAE